MHVIVWDLQRHYNDQPINKDFLSQVSQLTIQARDSKKKNDIFSSLLNFTNFFLWRIFSSTRYILVLRILRMWILHGPVFSWELNFLLSVAMYYWIILSRQIRWAEKKICWLFWILSSERRRFILFPVFCPLESTFEILEDLCPGHREFLTAVRLFLHSSFSWIYFRSSFIRPHEFHSPTEHEMSFIGTLRMLETLPTTITIQHSHILAVLTDPWHRYCR